MEINFSLVLHEHKQRTIIRDYRAEITRTTPDRFPADVEPAFNSFSMLMKDLIQSYTRRLHSAQLITIRVTTRLEISHTSETGASRWGFLPSYRPIKHENRFSTHINVSRSVKISIPKYYHFSLFLTTSADMRWKQINIKSEFNRLPFEGDHLTSSYWFRFNGMFQKTLKSVEKYIST